MLNTITIPAFVAGCKMTEAVEGRGFQYKGVALHLRKINSLWVISLFNTGLLTRGSARTIEEAIAKYDINDGAIIENWKYQPGCPRIYDLKKMSRPENEEQIIDLEYSNGRLVIGQQIKAGDLI